MTDRRPLMVACFVPACLAAGLGLFVLLAPPVQPDRPWSPDDPWLPAWAGAQIVPSSPAPVVCCAPAPDWGAPAPRLYESGGYIVAPSGGPR